MKKYVALFVLVLALTATPVFAKEGKNKGEDRGRGLKWGNIMSFRNFDHRIGDKLDASRFIITGTVGSKTDASLVITAKVTVHVSALTNNLVTVNINSDTKITSNGKNTVPLADVKIGDQVIVTGSISGTTLTATSVYINTPQIPEQKKKVFGEITAKTTTNGTTSVTIKNNVTGTSETVTVDDETKVRINGETKVVADIAVGDSGWVKFKTKAGAAVTKIFNLFR